VKWIDGYGLGVLIAAFKSACDAGGSLKLFGVNERIQYILAITQLAPLFDTYGSEGEALSGANPASPLPHAEGSNRMGGQGVSSARQDFNKA
jgi:anti-anti-sigma regulatory factor